VEKAVQRLKDPPQARPLGEEVFHARSTNPHSIFSKATLPSGFKISVF